MLNIETLTADLTCETNRWIFIYLF